MQSFKKMLKTGFICAAAILAVSCSTGNQQATHHWVSQDKVAGPVYRSDVAACSQGKASLGKQQQANTTEFRAYQQCMTDRGYALVAANEIGAQE